ncbi:PspC domain-containing protein [Myroides injenensis]|uniref:PspC domain-containing protein n=1 Tax=Myroides injenensis TaxID=1183151 RepID=UPI000288B52E|nr:PspC domain-containing protein [Myroides injenensis]
MNKTLTVNIGGLVFHIDENAYHKLDQYLKAIKRSFSEEEQDEIIHDIEIRIAELFNERLTDNNQVITVTDVDAIISVMGKPEDYVIEESETIYQKYEYTGTKKLYRDGENAILGGVLSGLGHYFKIDTVWMRIIFLILVLFYGTGVLLYIILWIIVPKAKTTTQILEMEREPINITTIEKKVKENINYVSTKINEADYDHIKNQTKLAGQKSAKVVRYFFGILFIFISVVTIFTTLIGLFALFINKELIIEQADFINFPLITDNYFPLWLSATLLSLVTILPFVGLFIIGLRLIYTNIKYVGATIIGLIVLWFISLGFLIIPFLNAQAYNVDIKNESIKIKEKTNFTFYNCDSLDIKIVDENYFKKSEFEKIEDYEIKEIIQNSFIKIQLLPSFQDEIYGKVELSNKPTYTKKGKRNSRVYSVDIDAIQYKEKDDTLIIAYQTIPSTFLKDVYVEYNIYIPVGKSIYIDGNTKQLLVNQEKEIIENHWYQMQEDNTLKCIDCK